MRILIIFYGRDYQGGTPRSTLTIARGLVERGHEVHALVTPTRAGTLAHDVAAAGCVVHAGQAVNMTHPLHEARAWLRPVRAGMELGRRFWLQPRGEQAVARVIEEHHIDLVALSSGASTTGIAAARHAGVPFVWHLREFMQEDHGLTYYDWAHAYELMPTAERLLCVSQAVADKIARVAPEARLEVVHNGIDEHIFHPAAEGGHDAVAPVRLMFAGGLRRSKGAFLLLDALAQLPVELRWTLDVFGVEGGGAGERAADFRAAAQERGLGERVCYRGTTSHIADEYRSHDIQVVASRMEAFGRVTAESMFSGCAVVGSDSGGTPELVSEGRGYLFEPGSAASLAQALGHAISDEPERARRTERALAFAREHFSVNAYIGKVEAIYQAAATPS